MSDKAKKLIKSILLGAVASLYNTEVSASEFSLQSLKESLGNDAKQNLSNALKKKVYNNVLKVSERKGSEIVSLIASHTSHRSHSSHRSSVGSGASSSHRSHTSSSTKRTSGSYERNNPPSSPVKKTAMTYKTYELGERSLSAGMYGNDVKALTDLLIYKKYMSSSWITTRNGYPVYDTKVIDAVKRFQKDANFEQDGNISITLINSLRGWDSRNTTLILGVRELKYEASVECVGNDVNELIELLNGAGFPPNSEKIKKEGNNSVFTPDIEIAVKLFQAYNGLAPSGIIDDKTVAKLKDKAKWRKW